MKTLLTVLFACSLLLTKAQDSTLKKGRLAFFSTNQAVHLEGSSGSAFAVQSVNGVRYKKWGAGIGVGLDRYRIRSFPLFVHLQRQIPYAGLPLFIYGDLGRNYLWTKKMENPFGPSYHTNNGWYWDAGLQYQLSLRNRAALVFGAGYSVKTHAEETTYPIWCITGDCPEMKNAYHYRFNRISLKAGIQF